ncbi:MAG: class I SAM-dependent methyltransferase [Acidimicrobiia bacterium]
MNLAARMHGRAVFGRRVRVLARHIASLLPPDAKVLDVGCGDGAIPEAVMRLRGDVDVTGIDVAVRPQTRIPVSHFDGTTIPFPDKTFDTIVFVDVLHHARDATRLLAEAARVAPGAIVVKDHLADGSLARPTLRVMDWFGNAYFDADPEDQGPKEAWRYDYWPRARWERAFDELGLEIQTCLTDLRMYPAPASWLFDRRLHVLFRLSAGTCERA